ncbi:methylmalonyl-CoA mutase subunit beta [Aquimarina sp. U1-2]|uniref:methylmalonyl-CoA mutase subunit beta n=1 Tax=Aquimarina sp. U1-2 TaxID=2823141 RepID=UPI001AEC8940|nr:methylmalonyl-CoA mutase subunit beta [Aquimarina sp. U1-2]MBP2832367.1 methylmalonyl-CoA mutase subunit beta [Aquimarina sp. U1-2]
MTKPLFDSFDQVTAKEWKQKIQFDLKGADYNEALIFKSLEGIDIKPFYTQEDIDDFTIQPISSSSVWKNSLKIEVQDASKGNESAKKAITKGAESLFLVIKNDQVDLNILLQNIDASIVIYIETEFLSVPYVQSINEMAKAKKLTISFLTDSINRLAGTGNWFYTLKEDYNILEEITKLSNLQNVLSVDMGLYQNAGATMIQQLVYGIAHANEYLNFFKDKDHNPLINTQIVFKVALGGNYFFEIAKLRALRLLWSTLAEAYTIQNECHIIAYPSHRNKTILDYNVNMLRTTTECMSAILGGADVVYNLPYDEVYNYENDFGTRIALNQLLILKNESYFGLVKNPANGSYYIESLTQQMAEKALALFKNIEKSGGFLKQLKSGIIQKKIKESTNKEQQLFDEEKIILTGANAFKNTNEVTPELEKPVFKKKKPRKTLIEPILEKRLSALLEKNL